MNPLDDKLNASPALPPERRDDDIETEWIAPLSNNLEELETMQRPPGVGSMVFHRYRLQRILGRGGMGVVWLAVDTRLERAVALKFLPDAVGTDPVALRELKDETIRGLELAHPNIVRIHDFLHEGEVAAISMEFVNGKTLLERRLTKPNKIFSVHDLAPWVGQVCDALDYAHQQRRIVHRDLKPANLMVNSKSEIKITDFGIARSVSDTISRLSRTIHQQTSGTLLYMSPQQAMGDRPRPTDDVYALGATLYELLTSKPPFYSGDIPTQISAKVPPSLKDRREEFEIFAAEPIPREWEQAIASCLEKDPAKRPPTAGELARRLGLQPRGDTQGGAVKKAGGLKPIEITTRTAVPEKRRRPTMILGSLAMLALLGAAGTWGFSWWSHREGEWVVKTEPAGAQVTVDGRTWVAPATVAGLKPGTHKASIALEGYEPREVEFAIAPGQSVDLGAMKMERSAGNLMLLSNPAGASYKVWSLTDGSAPTLTGDAPDTLRLPVGKYSVLMNHEGELRTTYVEIMRNVTSRFAIEKAPPPEPAKPVVESTPPAAAPVASLPSSPSPSPASVSVDAPPSAPVGGASSSAGAPPAPMPATASTAVPSPNSAPVTTTVPTVTAAQTSTANGATPVITSPQAIAAAPVTAAPAAPPSPPVMPAPSAPQPTAPAMVAAIASQPPAASSESPRVIAAPVGPAIESNPPTAAPSTTGRFVPPAPVRIQPQDLPDNGYFSRAQLFSKGPYADYSSYAQQVILRRVQEKLKRSGSYSSGVDGTAGAGTQSAVLEWQREQDLPVTGRLDRATLASLGLTGLPEASPPKARAVEESTPPRSNAAAATATAAAPAPAPAAAPAANPPATPAQPVGPPPAAGSVEAQRALIDSFLKPR